MIFENFHTWPHLVVFPNVVIMVQYSVPHHVLIVSALTFHFISHIFIWKQCHLWTIECEKIKSVHRWCCFHMKIWGKKRKILFLKNTKWGMSRGLDFFSRTFLTLQYFRDSWYFLHKFAQILLKCEFPLSFVIRKEKKVTRRSFLTHLKLHFYKDIHI